MFLVDDDFGGTASCFSGVTVEYDCVGCGNCFASCDPGSTLTLDESLSACAVCPAGTFNIGSEKNAANAHTCDECPAGRWNTDPGTAAELHEDPSCNPGPPGMYSTTIGSLDLSSWSVCNAGKYSPANRGGKSDHCMLCPAGRFNSDNGTNASLHTGCEGCSVGFYADKVGSTKCLECSAGKHLPYDSLASDQVHDQESDCILCSPGEVSTAGSASCIECEPGSFANVTASTCDSCHSGTYSSSSGATACLACPQGAISIGGSISCTECEPGTFANMIDNICESCDSGTYSSTSGASFCTPCAQGKASVPGSVSCEQCSLGSLGGSSCDRCMETYYYTGSSCESCPPGATCTEGTTLATIAVTAGNFRFTNRSVKIYECPLGTEACPGTMKWNSICADSYQGPLCSLCEEGERVSE